jgi:glycerol kinase
MKTNSNSKKSLLKKIGVGVLSLSLLVSSVAGLTSCQKDSSELDEIKASIGEGDKFAPTMDEQTRQRSLSGWRRAVKACRAFCESEEA